MPRSSVDTLQLTIKRMSDGSLVSSTDESIAPYDLGSTLSAFRLLILASDQS